MIIGAPSKVNVTKSRIRVIKQTPKEIKQTLFNSFIERASSIGTSEVIPILEM